MPILRPSDEVAVRERFDSELDGNVRLTLVTHSPIGGLIIPGRECASCPSTEQLVEEVSALSDNITLDTVDFYRDTDLAGELGIDKIPALIVAGEQDYGIRFYGLPSGYEFPVLLDAIVSASTSQSGLDESTVEALAALNDEVHIQVFVTPT